MKVKIFGCWLGGCLLVMGWPGALDRNFDPELRAWVAPDHVTMAADGRAWIGGGFDRGDGYSTGDLVRLGENGGVESEPARSYLKRIAPYVIIAPQTWLPQSPALAEPFLLENGDFLLKGESGGWLRMSAAGIPRGKAFPDRQAGETITPQFERAGKLWVIRQLINGERKLERRHSANGMLDLSFSQATSLPKNVNTAVPAPDGKVWLLTGDGIPWNYYNGGLGTTAPAQRVFLVSADGEPVGEPRVITGYRPVNLVAGPAGSFRITYGQDQSRWWFWPSPSSSSFSIEWYSPTGTFLRKNDFYGGLFETFTWGEAADGSYVVQDSSYRVPGESYFTIGKFSRLRKYSAAGVEDTAFINPGGARTVKALAGGKWLIDGMRRIHADGSADSTWTTPKLSRPAVVKTLLPLAGGKVLAGGDFAMVDGLVRNRLAVLDPRGVLDPSFILDERIAEWQSVAATARAIYVVTPQPVIYADGYQTNLLKLRLDGTIDESFRPWLSVDFFGGSGNIPIVLSGNFEMIHLPPPDEALTYSLGTATRVTALAGGDLLVETGRNGGDFYVQGLVRLREDGSPVPGFRQAADYRGAVGFMPLKNGGFISGGTFYRADGSVERDLTVPNSFLTPLCEVPAGVLFSSGSSFSEKRLALWTGRGFATWFRPPALDWSKPVAATSGEFGMIHLAATLVNGRPSVHRLLFTGQIDRTFRGPVFENRERQFGRNWWKAEESGKVAFDVALPAHQISRYSQSLLWHPSTRTLWTGGDFNMVGGQARDGLARVFGGFRRFW